MIQKFWSVQTAKEIMSELFSDFFGQVCTIVSSVSIVSLRKVFERASKIWVFRMWTKITDANYWKVDQNRQLTCFHKIRIKIQFNSLHYDVFDPDHVSKCDFGPLPNSSNLRLRPRFEERILTKIAFSTTSRENKLFQTIFWVKKSTLTYLTKIVSAVAVRVLKETHTERLIFMYCLKL